MLAGIASGWPPGDYAENYRVVGLPSPAPIDDVSGTLLGQTLVRLGAEI